MLMFSYLKKGLQIPRIKQITCIQLYLATSTKLTREQKQNILQSIKRNPKSYYNFWSFMQLVEFHLRQSSLRTWDYLAQPELHESEYLSHFRKTLSNYVLDSFLLLFYSAFDEGVNSFIFLPIWGS